MSRFRFHGFLILFSLLLTVYTLTNSGGFHIIDEVSLFAVTESVAQRGEVDTNAIAWTQWVNSPGEVLGAFGPDGEVYSKKGPAPAFLSVAWYSLIRLFAFLGLPWGLLQGTLLWNGVVTAATAVLLGLTALRLGYDERTGILLGLLFGLGTIAWPYANHLFGEPLSALSLLLCFYGIVGIRGVGSGDQGSGMGDGAAAPLRDRGSAKHHAWIAGIGAGIAIATVTAHVLLIAVVGIYLVYCVLHIAYTWRVRNTQYAIRNTQSRATHYSLLITHYILPFALPLLLALALLAWYNIARFGSPFDTGYHFDSGEGFTTPIGQGLWGLIGSPYRGVFWHTPLFIASVLTFPGFVRRHRVEGAMIAALSVVLVALYSTWWMWWGGFAWGPRFLVPLTPFWVLALAPLVERLAIGDRRFGIRDSDHAQSLVPDRQSPVASRQSLVLAIKFMFGGLVLTSFAVQLSAVVVNYVNYEIRLREIFLTDWSDPLAFGPPAQALADWAHSPVIAQWRLMAQNFVANTDLAWLWADGTVLWPVVIVGGLVLLVLPWWMVRWGQGAGGRGQEAGGRLSVFGRGGGPLGAVVLLLPLLLIAVWLSAVGRHPHYGEAERGYRAILAEIGAVAGDKDAILTITPYHYQIPMNWLGGIYEGGLPIYGYATDSIDHAETVAVLSRALATHAQIWYVTAGLPPADPSNTVERWLAEHAFKASDRWFDDFRLVRYGTPAGMADARSVASGSPAVLADASNRIAIQGVRVPADLPLGGVLPLTVTYTVERADDPLRWFVQLLDAEGAPVALLDAAPLDGYAAFPDVEQNAPREERLGVIVPSDPPPGDYRLIAGLYNPDPEGAPRLLTEDGADAIELSTFVVPPDE